MIWNEFCTTEKSSKLQLNQFLLWNLKKTLITSLKYNHFLEPMVFLCIIRSQYITERVLSLSLAWMSVFWEVTLVFTASFLTFGIWEYVLFGVSPLRPTSHRIFLMYNFLHIKGKLLDALLMVTTTVRLCRCFRYVLTTGALSE